MRKNKNVIIVEKDVQIAKGVFLSEGDALVKTRNGWTLVEAENDEYEKEVDEYEDSDEGEDEADDEDKVDEKKKR